MEATKRLQEEIYYARKELLKRGFPNANLKIEVSPNLFQELLAGPRYQPSEVSMDGFDKKFEGYEVVVKDDTVGFSIIHKCRRGT